MKKIILCGTPSFVIPFFEIFLNSDEYEILAVITRAAKEKNGKKLEKSVVAKWGEKHKLNVLEVQKINLEEEVMLWLKEADLVLVFAFGQIISEKLLSLPKNGFFNIHPSKLPFLRGPSPLQTAIMNGEETTNLTLIKMNAKMDEGDVIAEQRFELNSCHNINVIFQELGVWAPTWVKTNLTQYLKNNQSSKQKDEEATYCNMIKNEDFFVKEERGIEVINKIRALGYVFLEYKGQQLKCFLARLANEKDTIKVNGVTPIFIQQANKKMMHIRNFLNGYKKL